jgi:hypothetical protein
MVVGFRCGAGMLVVVGVVGFIWRDYDEPPIFLG